ncbi:MAG: protein kinase [Muribaculaceae bacterium]|nr:protein kinase [Muribaculaceae bacterium]
MLKKRIFIGRNEDNDIVVPAVFNVVSGSHADLKLLDSGEYLFSDHSTNGSTVKGKNIRNEAVTVSFGTPIILATRYALDWELVRELLPPVPAPPKQPTAPAQQASDWHPGHPADFTTVGPKGPQPVFDRSSHIDPRETRRSNDSRETRMSNEPPMPPQQGGRISRETRMSSEPPVAPQQGGRRATYAVSGLDVAAQELQFRPGDLFDGRFLLVRNIGAGASATVWEAQDTKTGGLKVAIKIFSLKHGMDSYGFQNLQREFTTVFNFTQQYLLTPSFYDVCEGRPYLVMRYCERGSAAGLIGRASEPEVIKMLHDVASGLEYLHEKKIIHQDIKPDNILIADNGDFMITDFGISATIDALNGDTGMSGGTRAYMGPERFNGQNCSGSDVWSLGATAYELVTGDAPYGDHGGMMQAYGNAVVPINQKLQPEVKDIIMRCLDRDPAKRPTAEEIRKKIDIYYETGGSWQRKNNAKIILLIAAAATLLLALGAGIWIWDYNRVKTYYYAAVTEVYGVPQGVGKEVKHGHRNQSFMLQKQRGKVVRMANVNSAGKVVPYSETEYALRYFPDTRYEYGDDGSLKLKNIYNVHGQPMFSMVMDINKDKGTGTAAFYRVDETKTEMLMPQNINQTFKDDDFYTEYSTISKYGYKYDSNGHVKELKYYGFGSRPTTDQYGIGGIKYKYDDRGLISQQQYVDIKGKPTFDNNGLSIKEYEYDDMGNMAVLRMLNIKKGPSHDGNHCPLVKFEQDEYGNTVKESYHDLKGKAALRTDNGYSAMAYEYDSHGNRVLMTQLDKKGKPSEGKGGWSMVKSEYNDDGFEIRRELLDAKGHTISIQGDTYPIVEIVPGPTGLPLECRYYNEKGKPAGGKNGVHLVKTEYDDYGNTLVFAIFDTKEKPMNLNGFYHKNVREYDQNNNCVSSTFYDKNGKRATQDGVISNLRMEYNPWGAVTAIHYYDAKDRPTRNNNLVAGVKYEYSTETGKQTKESYVDRDGKTPTMYLSDDGNYVTKVYEYNDRGHIEKVVFKDAGGKELRSVHFARDNRGNYTQRYFKTNGKVDGVVEHYKYDDNNNQIEVWYTNQANQRINGGNGYHRAKYKYDEFGNLSESAFYGVNGQKATDNTGIHRNVYVYDRFGQTVETSVTDTSGRPVNGITSLKSKYDVDGNEIETGWYDKRGRLSTPTGFGGIWAKKKMEYDTHGNVVKMEYFDTQGRPYEMNGISKYEGFYDDRNHLVKEKQYSRNGLSNIRVCKFNDQGNMYEEYTTDANNRLTDGGKTIIEYESDGVTPKKAKLYDKSNRLWASVPWDDKNKEWDFNRISY